MFFILLFKITFIFSLFKNCNEKNKSISPNKSCIFLFVLLIFTSLIAISNAFISSFIL